MVGRRTTVVQTKQIEHTKAKSTPKAPGRRPTGKKAAGATRGKRKK
jgi:hypothetical protein